MAEEGPFANFRRRRPREEEEDDDELSDFSASLEGGETPRSTANKRPRLSDENPDDDASETSEGALLPDSFRRSPRNSRTTTNTATAPSPHLPNGDHRNDDANNSPQTHQPGSIVRVKLTDFVTYTRAEFHPGPNLNMIIGPNGTGKSTLVCAICLALGWSTSNLGRAKDVGEFVKHGSKKAEVEIELARDPARHRANPVITTRITKEGNKTDYHLDGKKTTRKAVLELCRSFSIQIDNLCQFLPQDRVVEFAALSPVDLLTQTQRAAAPPYMSEWHEELKVLRGKQKAVEQEQQTGVEALKQMESRQRMQEADVQRLRERTVLKEKIAAMKKLRPFPAYNEAKQRHVEALGKKKAAKEELRLLKQRIEPNQRVANEKEAYFKSVNEVLVRRKKIVERCDTNVGEEGKKIDLAATKLKDCEAEIEAEKNSVKKTKQSIPGLRQEIQRIEKAMQNPPAEFDPAEMNAQIREKTRLARDLDEKLQELKSQMEGLREQIRQRELIIKEKENEKENLRSQAGQQANKLKRTSNDAAKAWDWIQQNRNRFQSAVFGPPIVECTVKDPRHAAAVESMIPDGDKLSFTVTSQPDMKMLLDQASRMHLHDINIRVSQQGLDAYATPPVSTEQLRSYGLAGWVRDLLSGPDAVLAMLCDNRSLHQMAYATSEITEPQFEALKRSPISSWVTPTQSYNINRRREYGDAAVSTRVQPLKAARFFTDVPVDRQQEAEIEAKIREARGEIEELRAHVEEMMQEEQGKIAERKCLNEEKKEIDNEKQRVQRAHSEFNGLGVKLERQQTKLAEAEEVITGSKQRVKDINTRIDALALEKGQHAINFSNAVDEARKLHTAYFELGIAAIEARSDLEQLRALHEEETRLVAARTAELETLTAESSRLHDVGRELRDACIRIGEDFSDVEREVYEAMDGEGWMPERLETETQSLQARLEMMLGGGGAGAGGEEGVISQFEKRARLIEEKSRQLHDLASTLEDLTDQIARIREQWEPQLDALIARISAAFTANFAQIHCLGDVTLSKPGPADFERWALEIRVQFRETEALALLDSHRQSGGERAVSTIFFLMALQSLSRAPFRVVDEINQGMDPRNERLVHSRMVDIACSASTGDEDGDGAAQGSQYFLITPKLLSGLKYHPRMKVHCIASGEYMPSEPGALDFGALAARALEMRGRQGSAVASATAAVAV